MPHQLMATLLANMGVPVNMAPKVQGMGSGGEVCWVSGKKHHRGGFFGCEICIIFFGNLKLLVYPSSHNHGHLLNITIFNFHDFWEKEYKVGPPRALVISRLITPMTCQQYFG